MNIFDFLTQDEIDDAPEDSAYAFTYLVRIAQRRLAEHVSQFNSDQENDYREIEEARYDFMTTVLALGRSYGIEPFKSMEVPRHEKFDWNTHRQFKADLDHYMAQLVIGNAIRGRRDSIRISPEVKERVRTHLHHIREHLDKAEMPEAKRATLMAKLADFEAGLEKDRLNVLAVGRVVLEILSVSCNVLAITDSATLQKLLMRMTLTVAEAKATDDEQRRLPHIEPMPAILPPRVEVKKGPREDFAADLDDEIPF